MIVCMCVSVCTYGPLNLHSSSEWTEGGEKCFLFFSQVQHSSRSGKLLTFGVMLLLKYNFSHHTHRIRGKTKGKKKISRFGRR